MCLLVRFPDPIPENVANKIKEFAWVKGPLLEILSAEAIPWYPVFDILEENQMTLSISRINLPGMSQRLVRN
jgi:hypothetical protein